MDIASAGHEERGKYRADRLFEVADRQDGYFTARQAREAGYDYRLQHYHRERGNWISVGHGLYRLRQYPDVEGEELVRLSLWSRDRSGRPQAVVSHETALRLHELTNLMSYGVHLSVPKGFRKEPPKGVVLLHKAQFDGGDVESRRGYKVTTPLRTILDIAQSPGVSQEHLDAAVAEALERGLVRRKRLREALETMEGKVAEIHRVRRVVKGGAVMVDAGRVAEREPWGTRAPRPFAQALGDGLKRQAEGEGMDVEWLRELVALLWFRKIAA